MAEKIILLSDASFFVKTIDAPLGVSTKDYSDFVDTSIDEFSPLPLEKTRRGFYVEGANLTIFAIFSDTLFAETDAETVKTAGLVLPAASLALAAKLADGLSFFESENSLALINSKDSKWLNFFAIKKSGDILEDKKNLVELAGSEDLNVPEIEKIPCIKIADAKLERGKIKFKLETSDGKNEDKVLHQKNLLSCDLRANKFNAQTQKTRRKENLIKGAFIAVFGAFALLLLWQFAVWKSASKVSAMNAELVQLQPKAAEIEKLSEESSRLLNFSGRKLHALESLAKINELRPDDIAFTRVLQSSFEDVEIAGKAPSLAAIDQFVKRLRRDAKIASITPTTESAAKGAKFVIKIKFKN